MPAFTFTSPDGKSYTVNGPDGATKEQAFSMLQKQLGSNSQVSTGAPAGSGYPAAINPVPQQQQPTLAPTPAPAQTATPYTPKFANTIDPFEGKAAMAQGVPNQIYSPQQLSAAQQGVNVDANAGVSTARANFAATQEQRDQFVANQLKAKYGNVPIRTGKDSLSGDVEWFNKKANGGHGQWQAAGDSFGGQAVNAIPAATEIAGGVAGSFIPGANVIGDAVGAGLGRAAGQEIKNKIGEHIFGDTGLDRPNPGNEGLVSTAGAAAGGLALSGIPAGFRMAFKGADVAANPRVIGSILSSYDKNISMVNEINAALEKAGATTTDTEGNTLPLRLNMSVPRVAMIRDAQGRTNVAAVNMADEEPIVQAHKDLGAKFNATQENNTQAIEDYWQNEINAPFAYQNINNQNWQENLARIYQNVKDGQIGPAQQAVEAAEAKARQTAGNLPNVGDLPLVKGGQLVRQANMDYYQTLADDETAKWGDYQTKAKYRADGVSSPIRVPITEDMMAIQRAFSKLSMNGLTDAQRARGGRYLVNLTPGVNFSDQTVDLAMLDRQIKELREEARNSLAGNVTDGMSSHNRNMLLSGLTDMRDQFMSLPENAEMQSALDTAEAATVRKHNELDRGFMADFLAKNDNGGYRLADPYVLHQIFKDSIGGFPNKGAADQLATIVRGSPEAKQAILDYSHALYNANYTKEGLDDSGNVFRTFDPKGHAAFNRDIMPVLDSFLDPAERAQIRQYGGLAKAVVKAHTNLKAAEDAWSQSDSGKLGSRLSTETFVNQFFDRNKSFADKNLAFIRNKLDGIGTGNTDAMDRVRAGIISEFNNRIRDPGTGLIDPKKLGRVFTQNQDRFTRYFGSDFADNVSRVSKLMRAQNQGTNTVEQYNGKTWLSHNVRYLVLGPLSPENRKLTIMEGWRTRSYASRLEQAMYDPSALRRLANQQAIVRPFMAKAGVAAGITGENQARGTQGSSLSQQKQQGQGHGGMF
jgi:hypothetical protein